MRRMLMLGGTLVILVALGGCGGEDAPEAAPPATTPAATDTEVPDTQDTDAADTGAADTGGAETEASGGGSFESATFAPGATIDLASGWTAAEDESMLVLQKLPEGTPDVDFDTQLVPTVRFIVVNDQTMMVYDPAVDPDDPAQDPLIPVPESFVDWLADNNRLEAEPPTSVAIAGLEAATVETATIDAAEVSGLCDDVPCVPVLHLVLDLGSADVTFNEGTRQRSSQMDVPGMTVLVIVQAAESDYETVSAEIDDMLASLEFAG